MFPTPFPDIYPKITRYPRKFPILAPPKEKIAIGHCFPFSPLHQQATPLVPEPEIDHRKGLPFFEKATQSSIDYQIISHLYAEHDLVPPKKAKMHCCQRGNQTHYSYQRDGLHRGINLRLPCLKTKLTTQNINLIHAFRFTISSPSIQKTRSRQAPCSSLSKEDQNSLNARKWLWIGCLHLPGSEAESCTIKFSGAFTYSRRGSCKSLVSRPRLRTSRYSSVFLFASPTRRSTSKPRTATRQLHRTIVFLVCNRDYQLVSC